MLTKDLEAEFGVPDEDTPEWTDEDFLWAVRAMDFGGHAASLAFLMRRQDILRAAASLGIPKETFLPFAPTKPGFEQRITAAFGPFPKAAGLAAE